MDLQLRPVGQAPGQLRAGEAFCLREIEIRKITENARQENAVSAGERPRAFVIPGLCRLDQSGEIRRAEVSPCKPPDLPADHKEGASRDQQDACQSTQKNPKSLHLRFPLRMMEARRGSVRSPPPVSV